MPVAGIFISYRRKNGRFLINRTLNTGYAPITLLQNWNPDAAQ